MGNSLLHSLILFILLPSISMSNDLLFDINKKKVDLIRALENHKKLFSTHKTLESKFMDISFDFENVDEAARDFISVATKYVKELEKIKMD